MGYEESDQDGLEWNGLQRDNTIWNMVGDNEYIRTERNLMDHSMKVFLRKMSGDNESDQDGLE